MSADALAEVRRRLGAEALVVVGIAIELLVFAPIERGVLNRRGLTATR